jgi:hypothetical protein
MKGTSLLLVAGCLGIMHGQQAPSVARGSSHDSQFQARLRDFDQTIGLLETGVRLRWSQDRLSKAFVATYGPGISSGTRMSSCGYPVLALLTPRTAWDERPPFAVETRRTLAQCQSQRAQLEELMQIPKQ